ncbi:Imm32 family immunity protein [Kitasatospora sp. KL5]|uniref:Imm32 family immunity protein n=1 Tax=Kitasatospora sp. KL5 TaxID=3425125 RepID=UPI003D6E2508
MLQVLYSGGTGELELSGTRSELLALGQLLRAQAGSRDLAEDRHPFPYERSLSRIAIREDPELDNASIVVEESVLRIRGGRKSLDLLADNIEDFASAANARHHCHVDPATYDYIAPESDSLVIAFMR